MQRVFKIAGTIIWVVIPALIVYYQFLKENKSLLNIDMEHIRPFLAAFVVLWIMSSIAICYWLIMARIAKERKESNEDYQEIKRKINALQLLRTDDGTVIMNIMEGISNKLSESNRAVFKSLSDLGDKKIKLMEEHPDAKKYKSLLNNELEQKQEPHYIELQNWRK